MTSPPSLVDCSVWKLNVRACACVRVCVCVREDMPETNILTTEGPLQQMTTPNGLTVLTGDQWRVCVCV